MVIIITFKWNKVADLDYLQAELFNAVSAELKSFENAENVRSFPGGRTFVLRVIARGYLRASCCTWNSVIKVHECINN